MSDAPVRPRPAGRRRWAPAAVWTLTLLVLTSWPSPRVPDIRGGDKVVHALLYAVLAFLVLNAVRASVAPPARRALEIAVTVLAVSAFGWADEWHQQYIPGRSRDSADWAADTFGAILGVGFSLARPTRRLA